MNIELALTIATAVIGATWVIRSKLSDIESALQGHVAQDDSRYQDHNRRIVSLEEYRNGRR